MATTAQLQGLADYAQARAARANADHALLQMFAALADARRQRDEAIARGDEIATEGLTVQIEAYEKRAATAQTVRDAQGAAIHAGRVAALAGGAGFDLLSARHPLLLLPVRLEARFAWLDNGRVTFASNPALEHVLLVRVFPDEIHEDAHDPELTADEVEALEEFRKKLLLARDLDPLRQAWIGLASRVGPLRAGWIGELAISLQRPGRRASRFSRPSVARLMPDCWFATAELEDGSLVSAMSRPLVEPLETGVSPDAIAWMTDFDVAEKAGMALIIRNLPAALQRVPRLRVIGVRGTLNPDQSRGELQDTLRAHQFTRGLEFVAPGTPTNSLPGARAPYTSRPTAEDVTEVNMRRYLIGGTSHPLCRQGDQTDGSLMAAALGIDTATVAFVKRADAVDQSDGGAMRLLLATATERSLIRHFADAIEPDTIRELLSFGVARVSALGPYPTLRVGSQPYGVLPILRRDVGQYAADSNARRYVPMLEQLRPYWDAASAHVPRVGRPGADPGETLVRILQHDGVAQRIAFRPFLARDAARDATRTLLGRAPLAIEARREATLEWLNSLGINARLDSPLVQALHLAIAPALVVPVIEPADAADASMQRARNYLELAASLTVDDLYRHRYPAPANDRPLALLFAIARLAVLELADVHVRNLLTQAGADPTGWDDEQVPNRFTAPYASMLSRLEADDPVEPTTLKFQLSEQGRDAWVLAPLRGTLRDLKTRSAAALDEQLRASLGLFSHRLDAWYTAVAAEELVILRDTPVTAIGTNIGAYGVLEGIVQAPRQPAAVPGLFTNPMNGGYVHAPSVNQGATAAVLRSVHLAHAAAGAGEAFSVDLSSARVRRGLALVEGVRAGQPIAALLGYQIERDLRREQLARFIAPLRRVAPLVANKLTPSTLPAESVAATNVIDGLTLLADAGYDGRQDATVAALWARHPTLITAPANDEAAAFARVLAAAQAGLDAVADLSLAESVHQAVQGNPMRAGAAVDSLSGAPVPPAEFSIVHTPRSGIGVTHRLIVVLGDRAGDASGWRDTPRALAEPRLEAWARVMLPPTTRIGLRARFVDAALAEVARLDDLRLQDLLDDAQLEAPHLLIGALDVVALANPTDAPQKSALEVRLMALIERRRPVEAGDASIELVFDRDAAWDPGTFGLVETFEIARNVRDLLGAARALAPDDLARAGRSATAAINASELSARAASATASLDLVRAGLHTAATTAVADIIRRALFAADAFGVAGSAPISLRDPDGAPERVHDLAQLRRQVQSALVEVRRRQSLGATIVNDPVATLKTVFGDGFVILPVLMPATAASDLFQPGAAPDGATDGATRAWLARAARVRDAASKLDLVLASADAVAEMDVAGDTPQLHVAQLGGAPGERWAALPLMNGTALPGGLVSIVGVTSASRVPTANVAGLLVDEWVEVIPNASETTSVAFHYDAPTSTPPQIMLIGVPYRTQEFWTSADVLDIVDEALALGRIRMVETDVLPDVGQLLPAFVTAENSGAEVAGLDIETLTSAETT